MIKMKLYVFSLLTLLFLAIPSYAQQGVHSKRFTIAGPDSAINLINTAIAYHKLTWSVSGTASVCTVALDTSSDGTTWTAGGAITGQTCTSNGSSSTVNVSSNYVRINMTALTVTAGSSVTVTWDGYTSNPSGGGTITGCSSAGGIAFENGTANTLTCGSSFTWSSASAHASILTSASSGSAFGLRVLSTSSGTSGLSNLLIAGTQTGASNQNIGLNVSITNDANATLGPLPAVLSSHCFAGGCGDASYGQYFEGNSGVTYTGIQAGTVQGALFGSAGATNSTVGTLTGYLENTPTFTNFTGGTLTNYWGFGVTNGNGGAAPAAGTFHNNFGYYADPMVGGDTLNAAFYSADQGSGSTNYSFYSAGGVNYLARNSIGVTPTDALRLFNTTAAAAGAQQFSPSIHLEAQGWKTASTAGSQKIDYIEYIEPVQGSSAPDYVIHYQTSVNGASYADIFNYNSQASGALNFPNLISGPILKVGQIENFNTNHMLMDVFNAVSIAGAGCGGSGASIVTTNGSAAFKVGVGTSNTGTCTVTMPTATTDWVCSATDITTTSTLVSMTKSVPTSGHLTTQITLQNYTDVSGTHAWVDSDVIAVSCWGE